MSKPKSNVRHLSVRLADDVSPHVSTMAALADWSEAALLNHLARVGLAFGANLPDRAAAEMRRYRDAVFAHAVWVEAEDRIRAAGKSNGGEADQMMLHEAVVKSAGGIVEGPETKVVPIAKVVRTGKPNRRKTAKKK